MFKSVGGTTKYGNPGENTDAFYVASEEETCCVCPSGPRPLATLLLLRLLTTSQMGEGETKIKV